MKDEVNQNGLTPSSVRHVNKRKTESSIIFSWHVNDSYQMKTKQEPAAHASKPISTVDVENNNSNKQRKA